MKAAPNAVALIGPFPLPVHGMAYINAAVYEFLQAEGMDPIRINTRARTLNRSLFARLGRLPLIAQALLAMLRLPSGTRATYMSVSAGWGQVYEIMFVVIARARGLRIFFHHHNYAYIDRLSRLTRLLFTLAGSGARHIVLSRGMERKLRNAYSVASATVISNLAFLPEPPATPLSTSREELRTLGYISNISVEKGIFLFLDTIEAVRRIYPDIRCIIAGPYQDGQTQVEVERRMEEIGGIDYLGPVYGSEKERFFSAIDVLIFPTLYKNEAEPIVILESRARGIPVIAYDRGSISELVASDRGELVNRSFPFVQQSVAVLADWIGSPAEYRAVSADALRRHSEAREKSCQELRALVSDLAN